MSKQSTNATHGINSKLFRELMTIIKAADKYITDRKQEYDFECGEYKKAHKNNQGVVEDDEKYMLLIEEQERLKEADEAKNAKISNLETQMKEVVGLMNTLQSSANPDIRRKSNPNMFFSSTSTSTTTSSSTHDRSQDDEDMDPGKLQI